MQGTWIRSGEMKEPELIKNAVTLREAAARAVSENPCGIRINFICPICGKDAVVIKSPYNSHLHTWCGNCDISVCE